MNPKTPYIGGRCGDFWSLLFRWHLELVCRNQPERYNRGFRECLSGSVRYLTHDKKMAFSLCLRHQKSAPFGTPYGIAFSMSCPIAVFHRFGSVMDRIFDVKVLTGTLLVNAMPLSKLDRWYRWWCGLYYAHYADGLRSVRETNRSSTVHSLLRNIPDPPVSPSLHSVLCGYARILSLYCAVCFAVFRDLAQFTGDCWW